MRTEVTKRERSPYAICSLLPLMKAGAADDAGVWPIAGVTAPKVKPPANAAPPFRNSLRAGRFEPIGLSFADELPEHRFPAAEVYAHVGVQSSTVRSAPLQPVVKVRRRARRQHESVPDHP